MNRTQYTVKIARNVEEIQQLGSTWESLQWHPNASLHYFLRLLEIRPSIERPHVTMLLECGKPRALLVGRIERAPFHINIGYRTIWSPSMRFLNINYGGVLGDVSLPCSDILIAELIEVIKRGEADIVYLNHLNINSPLYSSAITIPSIVCRDHSPVRNMHWQIILPDTIERVYETLPTKRRHELRRKARQLEKVFSSDIAIHIRGATDDVSTIIDDAEAIARKTYQRSLGAGFHNDTETRHRILLLAHFGWLRTYFLYIGGEPCAFWIGTRFGDTFYLDYTGYNPDYKNYEPGIYLFLKMLEDLCFEDIKFVDFGFGDAFYKNRFGNNNWVEASVFLFPPTVAGLVLNSTKALVAGFSELGKNILNSTGALQKAKRAWRDRLRFAGKAGK